MRITLLVAVPLALACSEPSSGTPGNDATGGTASRPAGSRPSVLVFSRTAGYRHAAIPAGIAALRRLATEQDWSLVATEDATTFTDGGLAPYDVAVFLMTTGDVLNAEQELAFERFLRAPKGFVGIHSASDTEYDWPFYGELVGAYFREHPPGTAPATVVVEEPGHPATAGLPARWTRTDEWYAFRQNPRGNVTVLLSLDESTYAPGSASMDGDHPIAWSHTLEGARAVYTALGHTSESYEEPLFLEHVAGAVAWAAAR